MKYEGNAKNKKQNEFVKSAKFIISQAKQGSKTHIIILAGTAIILVAIIGVAIWGISSLVGGGGETPEGVISVEIDPDADSKYDMNANSIDSDKLGKTVLPTTADAGDTYIAETLFVGDSNTVRTMMYGYTTWDNVVGATSMGIQHVTTKAITKFAGVPDLVDVPTSVKTLQPKRIVMTYGTNNTIGWSDKKFIEEYTKAAKAVATAYPYTDIIINAIPPIDKQRENLRITMQTIDGFNKALAEMCDKNGYKFLNSAEALKDEKTGFAKTDYTISDGVHLSQKGMDALFDYIKTHSYVAEDRRPKPLSYIPKRLEDPTGIIGSDPIAVRGGRVSVAFISNNYDLGSVDGEAEQRIKRSDKTSSVSATPKSENGGVFTGWSADYEGISDKGNSSITFTVPQLSEDITDVKITANFKKVGLTINKSSISLEKNGVANLTAGLDDDRFAGDKTITWSSTNPSVATVDANGRVVGTGNGQATIKASILGGKVEATCSVSVAVTLKSIAISAVDDKKEIGIKQTLQLAVVANPSGSPMSAAAWSSSDTSIATVSSAGLVTATEKGGNIVITAKVGELSATYSIKITAPKPITGVTLTPGSATINPGATVQLTGAVTPGDSTESREVTYTSSNDNVAKVNASGLVTAVAAGDVTITCKSKANPEKYATAAIKVKAIVVASGITLSQSSATITVGGTVSLTATVTPSDTNNKTVAWSTSNGGVASVANGVVTGIAAGSATISATINGIAANCAVTVSAPETPTQLCGIGGCTLPKGHTDAHNKIKCADTSCNNEATAGEYCETHKPKAPDPTPCTKNAGCVLLKDHEGDCKDGAGTVLPIVPPVTTDPNPPAVTRAARNPRILLLIARPFENII